MQTPSSGRGHTDRSKRVTTAEKGFDAKDSHSREEILGGAEIMSDSTVSTGGGKQGHERDIHMGNKFVEMERVGDEIDEAVAE